MTSQVLSQQSYGQSLDVLFKGDRRSRGRMNGWLRRVPRKAVNGTYIKV